MAASFTFPSKGFRLAYQLAPCSRTYSQPHGRVLSPSWPHRLPRNQKTLFELTINNIFHQESDVQLHNHSSNGPLCLSFLPLHGHCLFPQLFLLPLRGGNFSTNNNQQTSQVHDGATEAAPLLTRLCGRALPPSISSRCGSSFRTNDIPFPVVLLCGSAWSVPAPVGRRVTTSRTPRRRSVVVAGRLRGLGVL